MTTVRPLVRYSDTGRVEELRAVDDLPSSGGAAVPTLLAAAATMTLTANTQTVFSRRIRLSAGSKVVGKAGGILVGVR